MRWPPAPPIDRPSTGPAEGTARRTPERSAGAGQPTPVQPAGDLHAGDAGTSAAAPGSLAPPRSQWRTCPACSVTSCAAIRPDTRRASRTTASIRHRRRPPPVWTCPAPTWKWNACLQIGPRRKRAQRRRLAAVFLAAGEQLGSRPMAAAAPGRAPCGRQPDSGAGAVPRHAHDPPQRGRGGRRACRTPGLERLWSVDDHTADSPTPESQQKAYAAAIRGAWDNAFVSTQGG